MAQVRKRVLFVTGNPGKALEVNRVLGETFKVDNLSVDGPCAFFFFFFLLFPVDSALGMGGDGCWLCSCCPTHASDVLCTLFSFFGAVAAYSAHIVVPLSGAALSQQWKRYKGLRRKSPSPSAEGPRRWAPSSNPSSPRM